MPQYVAAEDGRHSDVREDARSGEAAPAGDDPAAAPAGSRVSTRRRRGRGTRFRREVRVDRTTVGVAGAGLLLVVVLAVLVTALVARSSNSNGNAPPKSQVGVTLDGPEVATYIESTFHDAGVTCPSIQTPVKGTFVCSDPKGASFTVTIIDTRGGYTVHPN